MVQSIQPTKITTSIPSFIIKYTNLVQLQEFITAAIFTIWQSQAAGEAKSPAFVGGHLLLGKRRGANAEVEVEIKISELNGRILFAGKLLLSFFFGKIQWPVSGRVYSTAKQLPSDVSVPIVLYLIVSSARQSAGNQRPPARLELVDQYFDFWSDELNIGKVYEIENQLTNWCRYA